MCGINALNAANRDLVEAYCRHLADERRLSAHTVLAARRDLAWITASLLQLTQHDLRSLAAERQCQGGIAC
ncbi:MAG: site-specific integrase [Limnobacter sp.]|nr:site-specific integrase [Limnobacter sp.]